MSKLVLVRHAESVWNKEKRFTGWTDVGLTDTGLEGAHTLGQLLKREEFVFDSAYTSVLKRAIKTLWIVLEELDQMWIPVDRDWRLNERHYGALQGESKVDMAKKAGDEQVQIWRRSYDTPPPALELFDERHPKYAAQYKGIPENRLPSSESLKDTVARVAPYLEEVLLPEVRSGKTILVSAHGNSIRAILKHLVDIHDDKITGLEVHFDVPIEFTFADDGALESVNFILADGSRNPDLFGLTDTYGIQ